MIISPTIPLEHVLDMTASQPSDKPQSSETLIVYVVDADKDKVCSMRGIGLDVEHIFHSHNRQDLPVPALLDALGESIEDGSIWKPQTPSAQRSIVMLFTLFTMNLECFRIARSADPAATKFLLVAYRHPKEPDELRLQAAAIEGNEPLYTQDLELSAARLLVPIMKQDIDSLGGRVPVLMAKVANRMLLETQATRH